LTGKSYSGQTSSSLKTGTDLPQTRFWIVAGLTNQKALRRLASLADSTLISFCLIPPS
jgi:hypothetical protein